MSNWNRLWATVVLAAGMVIWFAASTAAEPTKVTEIKGKKLYLYSEEGGKRVGSLNRGEVTPPLKILGVSVKGKFLVEIPGKGQFWILKAQAATDEGAPEVAVDCQSITKSYASSRGFGDCK
jgi:hypothetical protein